MSKLMDSPFQSPQSGSQTEATENILQMIRLFAGFVGVAVLIVGLYFSIKIFGSVYEAVSNPESVEPLIESWSENVVGDKASITIDGEEFPLRILAVIVLGGGAFVLSMISLSIMTAGGKLIATMIGERYAINRLLSEFRKGNGSDSSD